MKRKETLEARARREILAGEAPEIFAALVALMNYVGGWDEPASHPCGKAARLIDRVEEKTRGIP